MWSVVGDHVAGVVTVPKSQVTPSRLAATIGHEVDDTQDLVIFETDDGMQWPMLYVDALDRVSPTDAARIRASVIRWE
jgi:hypothetical protein